MGTDRKMWKMRFMGAGFYCVLRKVCFGFSIVQGNSMPH